MNVETIATALLAPAVTALATAGVVWLRESLRRRDRAFRRREALSNATQEVQFIQAYLAACRELDPDHRQDGVEERVRVDLAEAYGLVEQARVGATLADRERIRPADLAASVFLWGKLSSPWARAGLVVHYYLLTMVLTSSLILVAPTDVEFSVATKIVTAVFAVVFSVSVVWLWRRFLLWLDRRLAPGTGRERKTKVEDIRSADVPIEFREAGGWAPGRLTEWRPAGGHWLGRVRRLDGSFTDWLPAVSLRYPAAPRSRPGASEPVQANDARSRHA